MTPQELFEKIILGRTLLWRKNLEQLDGDAAAQVLRILAEGNESIRDAIKRELPSLLEKSVTKAELIFWLTQYTEPAAAALTDTIADAWAVSALQSIQAYNAILSFDKKAPAIKRLPETIEEVKKLAKASPFGKFSLEHMVATVFHSGVMGTLIGSIDEGMKAGWGYKKIVDKLIGDALPQGIAISRADAITLSRSYVQQASVNAQLATYWNNRDVIKGLKWTAILDNRVCGKCAALDGMEYLWEDEMPPLIAHPRCRCLWLPLVKSFRELGLDVDDVEKAARPFVVRENGNVDTGGRKILYAGTSKEKFSGWWQTLPYEEQIKSVGKIRTGLINDGKLKFADLVDKKTGKYFTLVELGFTESGKELPIPNKVTIESLEKMPFSRASKVVAENFKREFPEWSKKPEGNLPIAVLPENDAKLIGATTKVAVISPYTIRKQQEHHPELIIDDYLKAQKIIEEGAKYKQKALTWAFVLNQHSGHAIIIKATRDSKELYVKSLYRLSSKNYKRIEEVERLKAGKKKG